MAEHLTVAIRHYEHCSTRHKPSCMLMMIKMMNLIMILKNEDCDDDGNIRAVQILHDIHYFAYILIFLNNSDLVHN